MLLRRLEESEARNEGLTHRLRVYELLETERPNMRINVIIPSTRCLETISPMFLYPVTIRTVDCRINSNHLFNFLQWHSLQVNLVMDPGWPLERMRSFIMNNPASPARTLLFGPEPPPRYQVKNYQKFTERMEQLKKVLELVPRAQTNLTMVLPAMAPWTGLGVEQDANEKTSGLQSIKAAMEKLAHLSSMEESFWLSKLKMPRIYLDGWMNVNVKHLKLLEHQMNGSSSSYLPSNQERRGDSQVNIFWVWVWNKGGSKKASKDELFL